MKVVSISSVVLLSALLIERAIWADSRPPCDGTTTASAESCGKASSCDHSTRSGSAPTCSGYQIDKQSVVKNCKNGGTSSTKCEMVEEDGAVCTVKKLCKQQSTQSVEGQDEPMPIYYWCGPDEDDEGEPNSTADEFDLVVCHDAD